jgi:hypothetical protein
MDNSSSERVEELKFMGTNLTNENSIQHSGRNYEQTEVRTRARLLSFGEESFVLQVAI